MKTRAFARTMRKLEARCICNLYGKPKPKPKPKEMAPE